MGSYIEVNDTLQLSTNQGFPAEVFDLDKHKKNPIKLEDVKDMVFEFKNKPCARIFQLDPVRVYFAHNIDDKWLFWGRVLIQSLHITKVPESKLKGDSDCECKWWTSGTYKILTVYDPEYQETFTRQEAPSDRNYFKPKP